MLVWSLFTLIFVCLTGHADHIGLFRLKNSFFTGIGIDKDSDQELH
ncbi:hypothetical protein B4123_4821 [Bacillus paralicheniformis]|uniref:Uncharacterized protein n=1 Tax=Bacillus paralicheniformis TaxID=1648923 RepID=A0ABY3G0M2_9BACI|nr:hypothetical protein SC10_B2orf01461 [Bacillus paralicheniformis]KUL15132.1 hypothetical protein LI6934_21970 [Bacillus licheniformis LMG 6934]OLF99533.1 hypothetical protein B4123_4821 [Bacillus paralicheniformis]OLG01025.1 hypothetical protein B4125_4276 [Bacillus paralicheniformis]TWJ60467.1 hypothetical protein CHCC5023_4002 [Bacillus paralicheniformis]